MLQIVHKTIQFCKHILADELQCWVSFSSSFSQIKSEG